MERLIERKRLEAQGKRIYKRAFWYFRCSYRSLNYRHYGSPTA